MQIKKHDTNISSKGIYNITAQIQENTVLNRGLLDLGGSMVPNMIMSNNKDEAIERGTMSALYFVESFVAPFLLLPFLNKNFLSSNKIIKNFQSNEKRIIEVSKEYFKKDVNYMLEGIFQTAEKLEAEAKQKGQSIKVKDDFNNIVNRYQDKELLKKQLLKTHEQVIFSDFLATSIMWCATPWIATEITKARTNRSGFSATYNMANEEQTKKNAEKHEKEKKKKLAISALISFVPAVIFSKFVTLGLNKDTQSLLHSKNIAKKAAGYFLNIVKKHPSNFAYSKGMFPSKTIFAVIWALCDYPANLISARDKYERRDRAIRGFGQFLVFFGGDFALNNILGRFSDKVFKTQIIDRTPLDNNPQKKLKFLQKLLLEPKNFNELEAMKDIPPTILKRTKNAGAALYWLTLFANMAILGFGVPAMMNRLLKKSVKHDSSKTQPKISEFKLEHRNKFFNKFDSSKK